MIIKAYFDGGNQADSSRYAVITLAAVYGTQRQWTKLATAWKAVLRKHTSPWLHTTECVGLAHEYSRRKGWTDMKAVAFVADCVTVIENHVAVERDDGLITREGIRPCTITVILKDFRKVQSERPNHPSIGDVLTSQCTAYCFLWGRSLRASGYELFFDQGEPFFGHAEDR